MTKYNTEIDSVALHIYCNDKKQQHGIMQQLRGWIVSTRIVTIKFDDKIKKYKLLRGNTTLATLTQSASHSKFYIRIRFAGLKSYKDKQDIASYNLLVSIAAFLNTTKYNYRLAELDIAIDCFCLFKNMLVVCNTKKANVTYSPLGYVQYYKGIPTSYIEQFPHIQQRKNAVSRAYLYDKGSKEKLPYILTRFELKLQNRYFLKNDFDVASIVGAMNNYTVLYFDNILIKEWVIQEYNLHKSLRRVLPHNRLQIDSKVVSTFIKTITTAYVDFYGNIVVPK